MPYQITQTCQVVFQVLPIPYNTTGSPPAQCTFRPQACVTDPAAGGRERAACDQALLPYFPALSLTCVFRMCFDRPSTAPQTVKLPSRVPQCDSSQPSQTVRKSPGSHHMHGLAVTDPSLSFALLCLKTGAIRHSLLHVHLQVLCPLKRSSCLPECPNMALLRSREPSIRLWVPATDTC